MRSNPNYRTDFDSWQTPFIPIPSTNLLLRNISVVLAWETSSPWIGYQKKRHNILKKKPKRGILSPHLSHRFFLFLIPYYRGIFVNDKLGPVVPPNGSLDEFHSILFCLVSSLIFFKTALVALSILGLIKYSWRAFFFYWYNIR